jgi:hypothetical protein
MAGKNDVRQYSHGHEKLLQAMLCLIDSGSQRERLVDALHILGRLRIDGYETHIPKEILKDFSEFMEKADSVPATGSEGTIQATVNSLDDKEVGHRARQILRFYGILCRHV